MRLLHFLYATGIMMRFTAGYTDIYRMVLQNCFEATFRSHNLFIHFLFASTFVYNNSSLEETSDTA